MASVGTLSGPASASALPILQGVQVWVKYINSRGGMNGHAVKLITYDDGGDPARHRAQVQDAVERNHAIAFVANGEALTGQGSIDYITAKRIPAIGTQGGISWAYDSPMYFPHRSDGPAMYQSIVAGTADQAVPRGKKRLGTLVCTEVQGCKDAAASFKKYAPRYGLTYAYDGQSSVAQPDFTAECLAARNASVEVLMVLMDTNSIARLAASCTRQGFRPTYATVDALIRDEFKKDQTFDGMIAPLSLFPWFQANTPATREFKEAMRTLGGGDLVVGQGAVTGWVAGKLFERVAAGMPEPPTSEWLLKNLWSLKDEDLGGMTLPLTFVRDQKPTPKVCWFNITLADGAWTSPDNFQRKCTDYGG